MKTIRLHFQDHGQDFLTWDVDIETKKVVDARPFQASIWTKCTVVNLDRIMNYQDNNVEYSASFLPTGETSTIKYQITDFEAFPVESFCTCEMPAKVKGKNECWRCKKPLM